MPISPPPIITSPPRSPVPSMTGAEQLSPGDREGQISPTKPRVAGGASPATIDALEVKKSSVDSEDRCPLSLIPFSQFEEEGLIPVKVGDHTFSFHDIQRWAEVSPDKTHPLTRAPMRPWAKVDRKYVKPGSVFERTIKEELGLKNIKAKVELFNPGPLAADDRREDWQNRRNAMTLLSAAGGFCLSIGTVFAYALFPGTQAIPVVAAVAAFIGAASPGVAIATGVGLALGPPLLLGAAGYLGYRIIAGPQPSNGRRPRRMAMAPEDFAPLIDQLTSRSPVPGSPISPPAIIFEPSPRISTSRDVGLYAPEEIMDELGVLDRLADDENATNLVPEALSTQARS